MAAKSWWETHRPPTQTEQAGLANAAKNRAAAAAGVKPGPSIAVTNNNGLGVPIAQPVAGPGQEGLLAAAIRGTSKKSSGGNIQADWQRFRGTLGNISDKEFRTNLPQYVDRFAKEYGHDVKVNTGRAGDYDGFTMPDGRFVDVQDANGRPIWNIEGAGGGGGGGGSLANFAVKPWNQTFTAPTQEEAQNDEGFQFTLARGQEALERSAAAKGTLLTTGTIKELGQYNQGMGAQQYDKVYGRRMNEYQNAYNQFTGNEGARFAAHNANFGNNLAVNQNQFNQGLLTNQNAFNQQYSLANLGMNAANGSNNASNNYGNNAGDLYTQQGNAQAAANMYGSQGWQNALSNIGNLGGFYAGLYGNRNMNGQGPMREQAWRY